MKKILLIVVSIVLISFVGDQGEKLTYPTSRKTDTTDDYFGTKVADPYRWLEDDNSTETAQWVNDENAVTNAYLSKSPNRQKIKDRLTALWNYEKCTAPIHRGEYYFFYKNDGLQNQSVLYMQKGLTGKPEILLDPNKFSADGTTSLSGISIRKDAKYMAYNISKAGSDWNEICVMDLTTKKPLADTLRWIKFSEAAWKGDGFYYSHYPEPMKGATISNKNENNKVYYHKLDKKQSSDEMVYEDLSHPNRNYGIGITEDEKYMLLTGTESTSGNSLAFRLIDKKVQNWTSIDNGFDSDYNVIDNIGTSLLVLTNKNAPRNRVVLIDSNNPKEENWKTIIPETKDLLQSVSLNKGKLIATYLKNVATKIYVYSMEGKVEKEITLPALGIVSAFNCEKEDSIAFFSFTNFVTPTSIFRYNLLNDKTSSFFKPKVDFDSQQYETKQVFYKSKDGTNIPMALTYKRGLQLNSSNPTFLYGYGGFNISVTPDFKPSIAVLLENGFIYAVPSLRGGGEFGEEWHKAGTLCHKQNVFDDFISAANYLFKNNYTSQQHLAIHGRSNGGLLIGAVMTQEPAICKVALPGVGVLDMLRYHKFTIGYFWATDYGRSDSSSQFACLYKYSPLHNVTKTAYPATMITTADHDDRVVPAHSFKFAATLQENQQGNNPVLIRIDKQAGHGSGKPTSKQIDEWTDIWSFVFQNLDVKMK